MIHAYTSEWLKIRRPAALLGGAGTMIGFAVLGIARGGTSTVSYTSALLLVGVYLVAALGVAGSLFRYRDVAT